jgi:hypothetical protein
MPKCIQPMPMDHVHRHPAASPSALLVERFGMLRRMRLVHHSCSLARGIPAVAVWALLLGCGLCAAEPVPAGEAPATPEVHLEGQRKFLVSSIAWCVERVPALKGELNSARSRAEPQIQKAEALIGEQIAATIKSDKPLLDQYIANWAGNADVLLASLKRQNAESACPTLRDNWQELDADVILEDWQNFLRISRPEAE